MKGLEGNRKFFVSIFALAILGAVAIFGKLPPEQITSLMQWGVPTVIGVWGLGNAHERNLKKNGM